jgi:hypothetical protein
MPVLTLITALIALLCLWFPVLLVLKWVCIVFALLFMLLLISMVRKPYRILIFLACSGISLGMTLSWHRIEKQLELFLYWYGVPETTFLDRMLSLGVVIACGVTLFVLPFLILYPVLNLDNTDSKTETEEEGETEAANLSPVSSGPERGSYEDLVRLLGGDRNAAARLILQVRQKHPDASDPWIVAKVVRDLERDRY